MREIEDQKQIEKRNYKMEKMKQLREQPDSQERYRRWLTLLCTMVYFFSYLTRYNYSVVLVDIINSEGFTKVDASAALTGMFFTYGLGQLVSGYLGDHVEPTLLISVGLLSTSILNFLIPFCPTATWMTVVWCLNGIAQALFWPPMVKFLTQRLSPKAYQKSVVTTAWGANLATMLLFLIAPVVIRYSTWKNLFWICGTASLVMIVVWNVGVRKADAKGKPQMTPIAKKEHSDIWNAITGPIRIVLLVVLLANILQGALRDSMTSWFPTFISEQFHLKSELSILSGVFVPALSVLSTMFAGKVQRKWIHNEILCAALGFALAAVCCTVVRTADSNQILTTVFFAGTIGCSHAVNLYLGSILPGRFSKKNCVSTISGALNCAIYIGSAISMYVIARITQAKGWLATLNIWIIAALIGMLLCLSLARIWKCFLKENDEAE